MTYRATAAAFGRGSGKLGGCSARVTVCGVTDSNFASGANDVMIGEAGMRALAFLFFAAVPFLEIVVGVGALATGTSAFHEIEGILWLGFGALTIAVLIGARTVCDVGSIWIARSSSQTSENRLNLLMRILSRLRIDIVLARQECRPLNIFARKANKGFNKLTSIAAHVSNHCGRQTKNRPVSGKGTNELNKWFRKICLRHLVSRSL